MNQPLFYPIIIADPPHAVVRASRLIIRVAILDLVFRAGLLIFARDSNAYLVARGGIQCDAWLALMAPLLSEGRLWPRVALLPLPLLLACFALFLAALVNPWYFIWVAPLLPLTYATIQFFRPDNRNWFRLTPKNERKALSNSRYVADFWRDCYTLSFVSFALLVCLAAVQNANWGSAFSPLGIGLIALLKHRQIAGEHETAATMNKGIDKFVLYLREFDADEHPGGTRYWPRLIPLGYEEERLVKAFGIIGPVITIAKPDNNNPPIGALRVSMQHHNWKARVAALMESATAVVIRMPKREMSNGIYWEIITARQKVEPSKLLLLLPRSSVPPISALRSILPACSEEFSRRISIECRKWYGPTSIAGLIAIGGEGQDPSFVAVVRPRRGWRRFGIGDRSFAAFLPQIEQRRAALDENQGH